MFKSDFYSILYFVVFYEYGPKLFSFKLICFLSNTHLVPLCCFFSGLEVLAFPCNQFGMQEPGSNEEIKQFACTRYKAEFPIFDKV